MTRRSFKGQFYARLYSKHIEVERNDAKVLVLLWALRSLKRFNFKKQLHVKATNVLLDRAGGGYTISPPYLSNQSLLSELNISLITVIKSLSLTSIYCLPNINTSVLPIQILLKISIS